MFVLHLLSRKFLWNKYLQKYFEEFLFYSYLNAIIGSSLDAFMAGKYPDTKLTSYDETIEFCKNDGIVLDDHQVASLRKFWDENPIGLIKFG